MSIDQIVIGAKVIAGMTFGCVLWGAYGHVRSGTLKGLIAVGAAFLAYVVYVLVHIAGEELFPAARGPYGHIIAYDTGGFGLILIVMTAVIAVLRKAKDSRDGRDRDGVMSD